MNMLRSILLALVVAIPLATAHADPGSVRFREGYRFVGLTFTVNDHPCRAGLFGQRGTIEGMVCVGDPWAAP